MYDNTQNAQIYPCRGRGGGYFVKRPELKASRKVKEIWERENRYRRWRRAAEFYEIMIKEEKDTMGVVITITKVYSLDSIQ